MKHSRLRIDLVRIPAFIAVLAMLPSPIRASGILFTITFPLVKLLHGTDPGGVQDLSLAVDLDNHGLGSAGDDISILDGETVDPGWRFIGELDPRGRSSYRVPIRFELSDFDPPGGSDITLIDISPASERILSLQYDMETRETFPPGPQTGDEPGAQAMLAYRIETNPFLYDFDFFDNTRQTAPGQWTYEYVVRNRSESTFDLTGLGIPGFGDFLPGLEPGMDYQTPALISDRPPVSVFASVEYGDLKRTSRVVPALAPMEAVPEPSTLAFFAMGALFAGLAGMRGRRKNPRRLK
jgi:hypothetical protein